MAKTRPWTTQEEDQLRLLAKKESHSTIAAKLGRSEASIAHRARKLGLAIQPPIVAGRSSLFERIQHFFSGPFTIIKGIGWAISSLLAVYAFIYVSTIPSVQPSRDGVHPLSSLPFEVTNNSSFFDMADVVMECRMPKYKLHFGPIPAVATRTPAVITKSENVLIKAKGGHRTFQCDITSVFGPTMTRNGIELPQTPDEVTMEITVRYKIRRWLGWPRPPNSAGPFVLTRTTGGYLWSEGELIH